MKKIFLIYGHYNDQSFNAAIRDTFIKTAEENGNTVDAVDLYKEKFDLVISLFSLDYHYDFNIYLDYLKNISHKDTQIIFDTIRADYFKNVFKEINVVNNITNTVHKSQRLICSGFLS